MKKRGYYYTSIEELPIWNWAKIFETNNLIFLFHDKNNIKKIDLAKIWENIQNEHIKKFGINDNLRDILDLQIKIANMKCNYIINKEKWRKPLIELEEQKLNKMQTSEGATILQTKLSIEKLLNLSYEINLKKTSVAEFYELLNEALKQNKGNG